VEKKIAWTIISLIYCNDQCNETNVMHLTFNLFRIKGLHMFRALLTHPQAVLHKRDLVYCVRMMSVGCGTSRTTDIIRTQYNKCNLCSASCWWVSTARNTWRPLILNKLKGRCFTLVSLYWWCTVSKTLNIVMMSVHETQFDEKKREWKRGRKMLRDDS
jgi:hypothetical protein